MIKTNSSKIVAAVVGFALALTVFGAVGAATTQAQAMTLSQLVDLFISLGIISSDKAAAAKAAVASSATAAPASVTFSKDLTIGSKGDDVTALQNALGVSPATGYFGSVTAAAVKKYQTANGISATGFVGPLTRAALNKTAVATVPSTTTTTTTTTTTGTTAVNSGVEGVLTVDQASVSNSTVYEGDTQHTVLGLRLQARISDINVQRVRVDLGTSTNVYTKSFKTMYLTDDSGRVLAQADLNSNTVAKDGTNYVLTLGGFNYTVAKDTTKYLWVKADAYSTFKVGTTGVNCSGTGQACSITADVDAVRGSDGAGIDQYGPSTAFAQALTLTSSLIDSATVDLSINSANYKSTEVVADQGAANNELDQLPVLAFDLRANKDQVKVTDLKFTFTGSTASTTAYLYDGSTLVQSASIASGAADFSNIDTLYIAKDATKTLTLKVDIRNASATTQDSVSASLTSGNVTAENSQGTSATASGSATGETMLVRSVGPVFALNGISIGAVSKNTDQSGNATTTLPVTFNLMITAKGGDIVFGDSASTTRTMINLASTTAPGVEVYKNGAADTSVTYSRAANFDVPSSGVTADSTNHSFTLSKNNSVTIPVTAKITVAGNAAGANSYSVGLGSVTWRSGTTSATSTFMSGRTEWRSSQVALP